MDNQHQHITGYRDLNKREIEWMNLIKKHGHDLGVLLDELEGYWPDADKRWLAIARTDLQKGIMALTRAVARPASF